jgi:putative transposase
MLNDWYVLIQFEVRSGPRRGPEHEAQSFYGRADHRDLEEHEAGISVADLCRKHGVSDASIYKWKAKFGGMDVSEAKRLRTLEDENTRLKRLLADAMLDNAALKDLLGKKW